MSSYLRKCHIVIINYNKQIFSLKLLPLVSDTAQKMKFSIKDFFSKCRQILRLQQIWSHILKKSLMENFIFCEVLILNFSIKMVHFCWLNLCFSISVSSNFILFLSTFIYGVKILIISLSEIFQLFLVYISFLK